MASLTDAFSENFILFHPDNSDNKKNCFEAICALITRNNPALKDQTLFNALYNREKIGSTMVTPQIAIPHARIDNLSNPIGVITKLANPIPFSNDEQDNVSLLFTLFVSTEANQQHLNLLAQLATKLRHADWSQALLQAESSEQLWQRFCD